MRVLTTIVGAVLCVVSTQAVQAQSVQLVSATKKTFNSSALATAEKTTGGSVSADKKSISFTGNTLRIVVRTGPSNDMMSYRIRGLRNPTLNVPAGATLKVLFVNTDDDMFHDFRVTALMPPFDAKMGEKGSVGSAQLPHKTSRSFYGQELVFKAPSKPGTYMYVCTVAGHAAAGMYGKLVVK